MVEHDGRYRGQARQAGVVGGQPLAECCVDPLLETVEPTVIGRRGPYGGKQFAPDAGVPEPVVVSPILAGQGGFRTVDEVIDPIRAGAVRDLLDTEPQPRLGQTRRTRVTDRLQVALDEQVVDVDADIGVVERKQGGLHNC